MQKVKDGEVHKVKADVTREVIGGIRAVLEILFFWLGAQDSQFFLAPKARKSRHFLHRDKSA